MIGSLPSELGKLSKLESLSMSDNSLGGDISQAQFPRRLVN